MVEEAFQPGVVVTEAAMAFLSATITPELEENLAAPPSTVVSIRHIARGLRNMCPLVGVAKHGMAIWATSALTQT